MKGQLSLFCLLLMSFTGCNTIQSTNTPNKQPATTMKTSIPDVAVTEASTIDASWNDCFKSQDALSPDGKWTALICDYPASVIDGRYTKIHNASSQLTWLLDIRTILPSVDPFSALYPVHWTQDGRYLYLTTYLCCSDVTWEFSSGLALARLDLQTGKLSELLPLPGKETLTVSRLSQISYAFAFSPDDDYLVYSTPDEKSIFHIKALKTNEERVFNLGNDYTKLGGYQWSSDGSKVVFVGMTENYTRDGFSMFLFNPMDGIITTVLDHDIRLLVPYQWISQNNISLISFYLYQPHYDLNITTGVTTISSTPIPTP
jgi:hypothetical protein